MLNPTPNKFKAKPKARYDQSTLGSLSSERTDIDKPQWTQLSPQLSPEEVSDDPNKNIDPYAYNAEDAAESNQSTGRALFNTVAKFGGNLLALSADAIAGTVVGGISAANALLMNLGTLGNIDGEEDISISDRAKNLFETPMKMASAFANNAYSTNFTKPGMDNLERMFPVEESAEDANSILPMNLKTVDKIASAVAYIGSSIIVSKGTNIASELAKPATTKLFGKLFKTAADNGKNLDDVKLLFKDADELIDFVKSPTTAKLIAKQRQLGNKIPNSLVFGEATEAAAEARQTADETKKKLIDEYTKLNNGADLTPEQKKDIQHRTDAASAWNFAANMAVLKGTESIGLGLLGKNKWLSDVVNTKNITKIGDDLVIQATRKGAVASAGKLFQKLAPVGRGIVEEGGQEAVQFGSNDFLVNLYTHKNTEESNTNEFFAGSMESIFPALKQTGQGIIDNPKEAVESTIIGSLLGGVGGGFGVKQAAAERKTVDARTKAYLAYSNSLNGSVQTSIGTLASMNANSKAMDGAVFNGDRLLYETLKDKTITDFVQSRLKLKQYADVVDKFKSIKTQDIDEFNSQYGTKLDEEGKNKLSDTLVEAAARVKGSNDKIMANFGHKIIELEDAGKRDILPFMIQMDLIKDNLTKREGELMDKFTAKGIDYTKFQDSAISADVMQQKKAHIADLTEQINAIDADTSLDIATKNEQKKVLGNQILQANKDLSSAVTSQNYKQLFNKVVENNKEFLDTKESGENAFGDILTDKSVEPGVDDVTDIRDFLAIQKAKEKVFRGYQDLVGDTKYAYRVQDQIDFKNKKDAIQQAFTINRKIRPVPKPDAAKVDPADNAKAVDFEFNDGDGADVSEFIQEGDFYQLNQTIWRKRGKGEGGVKSKDGTDSKNKFSRIYEPVEVIKTNADIVNGNLVGSITVRPTGVTDESQYQTMPIEQFKRNVKPFAEDSAKIPFKTSTKDFYKKFANRAIRVRINGQIRTGFIRPNFLRKNVGTETVDGVTRDKKDDFYNASQFQFSYIGEDGKLHTESANNILDNYTEILDERESLKYVLKSSIDDMLSKTAVTDVEGKGIEVDGRWEYYNAEIEKHKRSIEKAKNDLASVEGLDDAHNLVSRIQGSIDYHEAKMQVLTEALAHFNEYAGTDFAVDDPRLVDAFLQLANFNLADDILNQSKKDDQAILGAAVNQSEDFLSDERMNQLNADLKVLTKGVVDAVNNAPEVISNNERFKEAKTFSARLLIASNIDPNFINTIPNYEEYLDKTDEYYNLKQAKEDKYFQELSDISGLRPDTLRNVKYRERQLTLNFLAFLQKRGFEYFTPQQARVIQVDEFDNTDSNEDFAEDSGYPTADQSAKYAEKQAANNENNIITTSNYDSRARKIIAPENGEEAFFDELTKDSFKDKTTFRVLRLTDLEKPEFKEVYDNLPITTQTPKNKDGSAIDRDSVILIVATDANGHFRKTKDGNFIISKYPAQAATDKRLNAERQKIQDALNLSEADQPQVYVDVKPDTAWFGGAIRSTTLNPFKGWGKGKFELPTSDDNSLTYGFNLKKGRLYFQPANSQTYIPVLASKVGNATITTIESDGRKSRVPINVVDNFILGMKFLANNTNRNDIINFNNNFLNLLFYTKDGVFNVKYNPKYINGNNTKGIYLENEGTDIMLDDVEGLKKAISERLFNPSSKLLGKFKDKVNIMSYYEKDGNVKQAIKQVVDNDGNTGYEALLKQFNLSTYASKSLYRNGNIELGDTYTGLETKPATKVIAAKAPAFTRPASRGGRRAGAITDLDPTDTTPTVTPDVADPSDAPAFTRPGATGKKTVPPKTGTATRSTTVTPITTTPVGNLGRTTAARTRPNRGSITGNPFSSDSIIGKVTRIMTPKQLEKAVNLLSKYGVDVQVIAGLINGNAWGLVQESGNVLLSQKAIRGTDYHEEFHIVSQHILDESELNDLYNEQRKNYPGKSDYDLEEQLAEDFRLFRQGFNGFFGKVKYYFNKILSAINGIRGIETDKANLLKDQLFRNIYEGKYYGKPIHTSTVPFYSTNVDAEIRQRDKRIIFNKLSVDVVNQVLADYKAVQGFTQEVEDENGDVYLEGDNVAGEVSFIHDTAKRNAYLNEQEGNGTVFDYFVNDALANNDNILGLEGTTLEAFNAFKDSFKQEFKQWLGKKIGITSRIDSELTDDEINNEEDANETGSNQIVKKSDDSVDHALDAVNQLNLLALISTDPTSDNNEFINLPEFIGYVYNNIPLTYQFDKFKSNFGKLSNEKYKGLLDNINGILNANNGDVNTIAFANKLFSMFSKQENKFIVLKKFANGDIDFLNQSHSKMEQEYKDAFKVNFRTNLKKLLRIKEPTVLDVLDAFGLESNAVRASIVRNGYGQELNHLRNNITKAIKDNKLDIDTLFKYDKKNNLSSAGIITKIAQAAIAIDENDRMFSIYNAEGNNQFALSNFASIDKILEDKKETDPDYDIIELVNLNGIQKQGDNGSELDDTLLNKATEHDLHVFTIKAGLEKDIFPFIFNGDKSMYRGVQMRSMNLTDNDFWEIFRQEVFDLDDYVWLSDKVNLSDNAFNMTTFGFLSQSMPEYGQLKAELLKGEAIDATTIRDGIRVGNVTITRDQVINARKKYKNDIVAKYLNSDVYNELGYGNDFESKMNEFIDKYQYSIYKQQDLIGKLYFYKDPTKRTSAWNSAKLNMNLGDDFINGYNARYGTTHNANNLRTFVTGAVEGRNFSEDMINPDYPFGDADDAQAHMTPDAYRFVMQASGFWNQTVENAYNVLENTDNIETATNALATINEQISVLKLQYYDLRDVGGIEVPTFYKYSVVPLFKVLTKGTNLDKLRNFMIQNNFHQHVADTANKVGRNKQLMKLYDENGSWILPETVLNEQDETNYAQVSSWKGLGIQVQMPMPHERVTFGTQMRKLIDEDVTGSYVINGETLTADELRAKHNNLINEKIEEDIARFKKSFGLNDDFKLKDNSVETKASFKKRLTKEISRRDVSLEFLKQLAFYQTYDGISNKVKLQYLLNSSIRNKIITQKMNGDSKAMMSSVGFESGSIKYDNRLKFYTKNEDGTTDGMEVLIPLTENYRKYVKYNNKTNLYEWNKNLPADKLAELSTLIGYRIPTQSQASIEKIKIKGFISPSIKNIVVVPFELTAKAGSDFDIDKLQLYYPTFKEDVINGSLKKAFLATVDFTPEQIKALGDRKSDEYGQYVAYAESVGKSPRTNVYDKDALDNRILNFYAGFLGSSNMRDTMLGTIDNTQIKDVITNKKDGIQWDLIKQGLVPDKSEKENGWELSNPYYSVRRRISFLQGKYALGATALAATHHAESQKTKIAFNDQNKVGSRKLSQLLGILTGKNNWTEVRSDTDVVALDRIMSNEDQPHKISDYLSQLINACVDVAKDDYITSANYNLETSGVATMLIRLGVSPKDTLNLIAHPEVISYVRGYQQGGSLMGDFKTLRNVEPTKEQTVLQLYLDLKQYSDQLNTLMQISNADTKGNGKTIEENEAISLKIKDMEKPKGYSIFSGVGNAVKQNYGQYSKLNAMFFKGDSPMQSATSGSFLNSFRDVVNQANNFNSIVFSSTEWFQNPKTQSQTEFQKQLTEIYNEALPKKDATTGKDKIPKSIATVANNANKFKNTFISYLMQQRVIDNGYTKDRIAHIIGNLPSKINAMKDSDNLFIQQLMVAPNVVARRHNGTEYNMDSISVKDSARLKIDQVDEITEAFYDLYNENPELANEIAIFSMFQSGIVNSPITLNNLIPINITRELLNLDQDEYFLDSLMQAIDAKHNSAEVKTMMSKANPTNDVGKLNTIYFRHFDESIIKKVNDIVTTLNKDCQ